MNIRIMYPWFNIGGCIIFLFIGWGFMRNDPTINENSVEYSIHPVAIISYFVLLMFCLVFTLFIRRHNKQNPDKKINTYTLTPPEFLEEDEMFRYATMNATKKVYKFITWALPAILVLLMLPFIPKYGIFVMITGIIIIQNLIYFFEIRKYKEPK